MASVKNISTGEPAPTPTYIKFWAHPDKYSWGVQVGRVPTLENFAKLVATRKWFAVCERAEEDQTKGILAPSHAQDYDVQPTKAHHYNLLRKLCLTLLDESLSNDIYFRDEECLGRGGEQP